MLRIKSLIESLNIFERNKFPIEFKILGIAFYIHLSSLRRASKALSEIRKVSKTSIWKWIRKFEEKIKIEPSKIYRNFIALDETCIKVNGLKYWIYAAIDIDRNELLFMKVYSTRNLLTSKIFISEVLKYCENNPTFIIDNAPWLIEALELLKLSYIKENFGDRSLIESVYSSF
jgi:putative transposase